MKARLLILLTAALLLVLSLHSQTNTSTFLAPIFGLTAPDNSTCIAASNLNQFYYATSSAPFARYQCKVTGWTRQGSAETPLSFLGVPVPLGFVGTSIFPAGTGQTVATALITDAPYGAHCDGATDDHVAIQHAIDAVLAQGNGVGIVDWPPSTGADYTQCNTGTTTLTVPAGSNLTINFHGSIIDYAGNGHAIESICIGCFSPTGTYLYLNDMQMLLTGTPSSSATGVYVDGTVLTMYNWGIGGGQAGAHAVQVVDFSQFISELGSSDALFFTQSSQVHALNDYYFPPTNGTVPDNTAAWTIDAPDGATTFVNTTFLWDNSDGATTGNVNVELLDSLAGGNGDQAVWFINTLMHVSDSVGEFILKFDASATEGVFGQFAEWDSGYPGGIWTGTFHGDLLVTNGTLTAHLVNGVTASGQPYSAAGVHVPTCNAGLVNLTAQVSDATTPTFLGTYASGGAVKAPVMCNGTNWVTY